MAQKRIADLDAATAPLVGDELLELEKGGSVKAAVAVLQDAIFPPGFTADFAGTSAPDGWLECDGTVISQTTYARLYAAIGTTWDTGGEGAGNFRLPDLRGAVRRGTGSHGAETMADGNPFAGPAIGSFENDQVQGHYHKQYLFVWGSTAGGANISTVDNDLATANKSNAKTLMTDGTNGAPRSGDETRPFAAGMLVCVKT